MHRQKSGIQRALKALVIGTMMVLMPTVAHALEVGKLFVYSRLHAPLEAEIELLSITEDEIESLLPSVAPLAHFGAAELENQPEIKVTVAKRADGHYALRLGSEESLSEPILQFTLHAVWSGGYLVHDFSALVDPANTVTNAAKGQQKVSTGVDELKPEFIPQPEQPFAAAQQPGAAAPEPTSAPAVLSPPRVLVEIAPRGQDSPVTTTEQSTATSSNKLDELGDSTEVVNPPVETETMHRVAEQMTAKTQPPLVQAQPQISRDEARAVAPEAKAGTMQQTRRAQQAPLAAAPKVQGMLNVATAFIREHPRWVLGLVAILIGGFVLIAGGLVVLVVDLRRHNITLQSQKRAPAPKVAVSTNASEDETHTDGNGSRRADAHRRRQGRRANSDRRKRSIPVAADRRSGLSRRRSEILDGGIATVSSEALDPIAEADVYLSAGSYDHAETTLKEALVADPARQELKLKLLQTYHQKGDLLAFNALAEELREVLDGPSSELWQALEANDCQLNGLTDDAGAAQEEIMLEFAEQERANGDAAPDMDTNTENAEAELNSYTIEFEPQPQDHTAVNTLRGAFNEFLQARRGLKARTIDNYKQMMEACFADWQKKTLLEISEDMVTERHQDLCQEHGKAYANRAMRCLRTMYNFFSTHYRDACGKPLVPENPVKSLTHIQS
ncbi:MAG: hypothetical protein OES46_01260 [Gammaproteobacteria bacterium]|nr:hypothetical protein [Gammaproteobacteria bacterium]